MRPLQPSLRYCCCMNFQSERLHHHNYPVSSQPILPDMWTCNGTRPPRSVALAGVRHLRRPSVVPLAYSRFLVVGFPHVHVNVSLYCTVLESLMQQHSELYSVSDSER